MSPYFSGGSSDFPRHYISFRYRIAVQVWAALFRLIDRMKTSAGTEMNYFINESNAALSISGKATLLITLSLMFPVITAIVVGLFAVFSLNKKVEELRNAFFLSSIEGSRLHSIDTFHELSLNAAVLSKHVSHLAESSPPKANLQSRYAINLLKFISLLHVSSKRALTDADQQHWYVKRKIVKFNFTDAVKRFCLRIRSFFEDCSSRESNQYSPLFSSDDRKTSYTCLYFKKVDTQFARSLAFARYTLKMFDIIEKTTRQRAKNNKSKDDELPKMLQINEVVLVRVRVHQSNVFEEDSAHVTVWVSDQDNLVTAHVYPGIDARFQLSSSQPFPIKGNRSFIISHVKHAREENRYYVQLQCSDASAFVDFESFEQCPKDLELEMLLENPYEISDNTIEWFKRNDLLDSFNIKKVIGSVIDDNPANMPLESKSSSNSEKELKDMTPADTLAFNNDFCLTFDPFKHRVLLVVAAVFYDAADAYRTVVGATGIEFFMDLLVVNGSHNIRKW